MPAFFSVRFHLYSNEEMKKVQFANGALAEAGFSGLNDINKFMTGKIARVNPYIGGTTEVYVDLQHQRI
jgi:zinc protease